MAASDELYSGIVAELVPVFAELGTTYSVRAKGVYDPIEMDSTIGATREVVGIVADQQFALKAAAELSGETGATWTAAKTLILTSEAAPLPGEEVLVNGNWYSLSKVVPIQPADVVVIYMLDVSK